MSLRIGDEAPNFNAETAHRAAAEMRWQAFPPRIRALESVRMRFDAFRLPARDCDVYFGTYPAGTEIEPHRHDTDNWGVITRGEMLITLDGATRTYGPGDWYHVPAGMEHSARCHLETEEIEFWFRHKEMPERRLDGCSGSGGDCPTGSGEGSS
jgi:quercetin dioxygenase-like cupin family protein